MCTQVYAWTQWHMSVESSVVIHLNQTVTCSSSVLATLKQPHYHMPHNTHTLLPGITLWARAPHKQMHSIHKEQHEKSAWLKSRLLLICSLTAAAVAIRVYRESRHTSNITARAHSLHPVPAITNKKGGHATSGLSPKVTSPNSALRPVTHCLCSNKAKVTFPNAINSPVYSLIL